MAIAFLATIAAQMGAAWFNSSRNKAHSKKMAELQRAYEEKAELEGIENARMEFAELCAFQREIEKQSQDDRLTLIRDNHEQIILQDAYENSLHKWPLLIPPYVIANAPLTIGSPESAIIPLNCILTTSSDLGFNNNVFHKLEEQIAVFCSRYWNVSANKSIRFFQEAWRDDAKDLGSRHKDIYAHLKNVPTLLISPILKNETILFRFYWWGLSIDPTDAHINDLNELNPELSISIIKSTKFTSDIVETIVSECTPKLEAFISFFADLYYWNFYKLYPLLPSLIATGVVYLPPLNILDLCDGYSSIIKGNLIAANSANNCLLIDSIKPICSSEYIATVISEANIDSINDKSVLAYIGQLIEDAADKLSNADRIKLNHILSNSQAKIHRSYICSSLQMLLEDYAKSREITADDILIVEFNNDSRIVSIFCENDAFHSCDNTFHVRYNYRTSACFVPEYLCLETVKKIIVKGKDFKNFYNCLSNEKTNNKFISELSISTIEQIVTRYANDIISCKISRIENCLDTFNELERANLDNIFSFEIQSESRTFKISLFFDRIDEDFESLFEETNEILIK